MTAEVDQRAIAHAKMQASDFGFQDRDIWHSHVVQYRDEMVADGWSIEPTYGSEPVESASRLKRQGFVSLILTRDKGPVEDREPRNKGLRRYEAQVSIWGPDGLAITVPYPYSFAACVANTRKCSGCKATEVPTERVGFAGRVCASCLPDARRRIETPGWCD